MIGHIPAKRAKRVADLLFTRLTVDLSFSCGAYRLTKPNPGAHASERTVTAARVKAVGAQEHARHHGCLPHFRQRAESGNQIRPTEHARRVVANSTFGENPHHLAG